MQRKSFRPIRRGQRELSARALNELQMGVEAQSRTAFGQGVQAISGPMGDLISAPQSGKWAKINFIGTATAPNPAPLSFAEQLEGPGGALSDFPDAIIGYAPTDPASPTGLANWPAYDLTGATHKVGDIVRLIPAKGGEYYEVLGATGAAATGGTFVAIVSTTPTPNLYSGLIQTPAPNSLVFQLSPPACWVFAPMGLPLTVNLIPNLYWAIPNGTFTPQGQGNRPLYFAIGGWAFSCSSGVLTNY